jgi:hypothetical protein
MDELGKWFMEVFTSINKDGRLGPPAASRKRVEALLEEIGGERVMKISTLLNMGNAEKVRDLASRKPSLGEELREEEPQKELKAYFEERAHYFEPCRKIFTRGLSLPGGNTELSFAEADDPTSGGSEAWEKVFQKLTGRENDDQESSNL